MSQTIKTKEFHLGEKLFSFFLYFFLILAAFICLYPLWFTVISSISDADAVYTGAVRWIPKAVTLEAYTLVFRNNEIWTGYLNTIIYTVAGTAFNLFLTIPAAYTLSKKELVGRGIISTFFLIPMYFGGGLIPFYLQVKSLNLINQPYTLVILGGISIYNMVVSRVYFQSSIPGELYESARIDGASDFRQFFTIALPLSAPILAVMALYYAVGHWNGYMTAMIYTSSSEYQPLQIELRAILLMNQTSFSEAVSLGSDDMDLNDLARRAYMAESMKYALIFIASAPMMMAYPFVQKYFVKGMMIGSLKG